MKKFLSIVLAVALASSMAGCSSASTSTSKDSQNTSEGTTNEKVKIIVTNGKGEIAQQFEQAAKDFMAANPDIIVEPYSVAVGDSVNILDKLTASGEVVSLAMVEPSSVSGSGKYQAMAADLSNEKWNQETVYGFKNDEGQIVGFPFAIEGFGLVYNQKVLDKAVGGTFDPFTINTRDKLIELLDKIQASGIKYPIAYQTEAWSVANHYSSQFINQSSDPVALNKQMINGEFDFANNAIWNGYYDTMDLLASTQYNKYGERPLGQYYDDAHLSVGKGESAMLFNGNWAYDSLKAVAGDSFGFIPVPVDNDPNNPLNNKIVAGPTQIMIVNKNATPQQQEAAKKFLNWLVYDQVGQDFIVNKSQIVSAFKNNPNKVTNPLGKAIAEAIEKDKTISFSTNYVDTAEYMNTLGPEVQKYIGKKSTRADLAKAFETYYKSKKK
ncbi:ABC transporter substrate-binding protein [Clostridium thermarum]|uniref:ABC transporter substrate-binding protein n=1 Tax=Clostridium thermarum TaxID=1716543 RepID=UPI001123149C|nr:ABC transporter substrate-binding protein [Clostridium thermarum]